MCGIAGWISRENNLLYQKEILTKMSQTLKKRGPDEHGSWLSPQAIFAHRRLTVIDPVGGSQPMVKNQGENKYVIVYNGELYNTSELRNRLLKLGHSFKSHSDTEVLLTSFIEWGVECVQYFNGIFAFAIWDEGRHRLFLARDRLGVKPLFFKIWEGNLLFGSELKTLLAHPSVKSKINAEGLAEVLVLGPGRTPGHGIFRGIKELKPGYWLTYGEQGYRKQQYWSLNSTTHEDNLETTTEKVYSLLKDAAERQLVSDVPICTMLSGGLDSSALSAFASRYLQKQGQQLNTYSIDYVEKEKYFKSTEFQPNSDIDWIPMVSDYLNTNHHYVQVETNQLFNSLNTAVTARDLPGMTDIDSSLYLFCQEIKRDATVALSGECADEIFGGYPWFFRKEALSSNSFPWMRMQNKRLKFLSPEIIAKTKAEDYLATRYEEAVEETPLVAGESLQEQLMRKMQYLTIFRWMPILLDRKDRMSMATGLEVRVPFCDHRLVEYAWNIPWKMKTTGNMEKGILRKALNGVIPEEIITRKKSPYPKTFNPNYLNAVQQGVLEILGDSSSPLLPLINQKLVKELALSEAAKINLPWFGQLMSGPQLLAYFIQVDIWLRKYKVSIV